MVRKMAYVGSAYIIGLFSASFLSYGINFALTAFLVLIAAALAGADRKRYIKIVVCALSAAVGMFIYGGYDCFVYRNVIKYDGQTVEIKGRIIDCADYSGDKSSYTVKGLINGDIPAKVTFFTDSTNAELEDSVSIIGEAQILKDSFKFPTRSYYKSQGIYLQLSEVSHFNFTADKGFSLIRTMNDYREYILGVIRRGMDDETAAVMTALLLGDKSDIEDESLTLMYRAGIGHIMAVSGSHLAVVSSFLAFFISKITINKYLRFLLLMIPVGCFVLLAGICGSVMRSAVMIVIVYGAELFRRKADCFNSLGIALIVLTVTSPFAVRDASLLLSAAGVFGIGVAAPAFIKYIEKRRKIGAVLRSLATSAGVTLVCFPITVLFFDEVSVISPITNILLIPICEFILICGVIITITGGAFAEPILWVCEICVRVVIKTAEFIGGLRFAYIPLGYEFARITAVASVVMAAVIILIVKNKNRAAFYSAAIFAAALLTVNVYRYIPDGNITVAAINEQSAVSVVIHDKSSACVIDLYKGGQASDSVVKYLNRLGIYKIDMLVLHESPRASVATYKNKLENFSVENVFVPDENSLDKIYYSIGENTAAYDENNGIIAFENCDVFFKENGTVMISCYGSDIIMYGKDFVPEEDKTYAAAVKYRGNKSVNAEADIIVAMSDKAEITSGKYDKAYIGQCVKFVIDDNGEISSEELS